MLFSPPNYWLCLCYVLNIFTPNHPIPQPNKAHIEHIHTHSSGVYTVAMQISLCFFFFFFFWGEGWSFTHDGDHKRAGAPITLCFSKTESQKSSLAVQTMLGTAAALILALSGIFLSINLFPLLFYLSLRQYCSQKCCFLISFVIRFVCGWGHPAHGAFERSRRRNSEVHHQPRSHPNLLPVGQLEL